MRPVAHLPGRLVDLGSVGRRRGGPFLLHYVHTSIESGAVRRKRAGQIKLCPYDQSGRGRGRQGLPAGEERVVRHGAPPCSTRSPAARLPPGARTYGVVSVIDDVAALRRGDTEPRRGTSRAPGVPRVEGNRITPDRPLPDFAQMRGRRRRPSHRGRNAGSVPSVPLLHGYPPDAALPPSPVVASVRGGRRISCPKTRVGLGLVASL